MISPLGLLSGPKLGLIALLAGLIFGGLAGERIGTWRGGAAAADVATAHAGALRDLNDQISRLTAEKVELELGLAEQNKLVAIADAETRAAEAAKTQADQRAADLARFSESRIKKLTAAIASAATCDDVLRPYWELRQ